MINSDTLTKKNKSLKSAIERYKTFKEYVEIYKLTKSLDKYAEYIINETANMKESLADYYKSMISSYESGNIEPLLSHLYDRLLAADEYKRKVSEELKLMLKES